MVIPWRVYKSLLLGLMTIPYPAISHPPVPPGAIGLFRRAAYVSMLARRLTEKAFFGGDFLSLKSGEHGVSLAVLAIVFDVEPKKIST